MSETFILPLAREQARALRIALTIFLADHEREKRWESDPHVPEHVADVLAMLRFSPEADE